MIRRVFLLAVAVVATFAAIAVVQEIQAWRVTRSWDEQFAVARAAGDCETVEALVLGGETASYLPALRAGLELRREEACGADPISEEAAADLDLIFTNEFLNVGGLAGEKLWTRNSVAFEFYVRAQQVIGLVRGYDAAEVRIAIQLERDCGWISSPWHYRHDRSLLAATVAEPDPSVRDVVEIIRIEWEQCREKARDIVARAESQERTDATPRTCRHLNTTARLFRDSDAAYRVFIECDESDDFVTRTAWPSPSFVDEAFEAGFYPETDGALREMAARGHVLAARDYAVLKRQWIESREVDGEPLPAALDPSWFAYFYARRAAESGIGEAPPPDFFKNRLSPICSELADAFYAHLVQSWSGAKADWASALEIAREARECSPYQHAWEWDLVDADNFSDSIPEFSDAFDHHPIIMGRGYSQPLGDTG